MVKAAFIFLFFCFGAELAAQVNLTTWKENLYRNPFAVEKDTGQYVIGDTLVYKLDKVFFTIDYQHDTIQIDYFLNDAAVTHRLSSKGMRFVRDFYEPYREEQQIHAGNAFAGFYFNKYHNQLQYYYSDTSSGMRTEFSFFGDSLLFIEKNTSFKPFYDEPHDTSAYRVDLYDIEGSWMAIDTKHFNDTSYLKIEIDTLQQFGILLYCDTTLKKPLIGQYAYDLDEPAKSEQTFTLCVSHIGEILFTTYSGCEVYDQQIRYIDKNSFMFDWGSSYLIYKRLKED